MYAAKREEGTGRPLTGKEKGLAIPLDFYHWLHVAYDSRNRVGFLLYLWLVCLHSLSALVFIPPSTFPMTEVTKLNLLCCAVQSPGFLSLHLLASWCSKFLWWATKIQMFL